MTTAERHPAARRPTRTFLAALTLPNLLAWCFAAWCTWEVVTDKHTIFRSQYTAGALLAVVIAASAAILWLAILAWKATGARRVRLTVFYTLACASLWAASLCMGSVTIRWIS